MEIDVTIRNSEDGTTLCVVSIDESLLEGKTIAGRMETITALVFNELKVRGEPFTEFSWNFS